MAVLATAVSLGLLYVVSGILVLIVRQSRRDKPPELSFDAAIDPDNFDLFDDDNNVL
jgi:hypothetical protein